jgi:uncharacterized membrane protein YkoI
MRILLLLLLLALGTPSWADRSDHDRARDAVRSGEALPLNEILSRIRPRLGGEIVHVKFERENGRYVYEFRVVGSDGRLRRVHVDATNANILDEEDR